MILTPTYHLFDLYQNHQDQELVDRLQDTDNTFDHPDTVKAVPFTDLTLQAGKLSLHIPPCSVISITLK